MKARTQDDLVLTIDTDDEFSDHEEDTFDLEAVNGPKRKHSELEQAASKRQKKHKKPKIDPEDDMHDAPQDPSAADQDFSTNFEFDDLGDGSGLVDGMNGLGDLATSKTLGLSVDDIVARRRKAQATEDDEEELEEESLGSAGDNDEDEEDEHDDDDDEINDTARSDEDGHNDDDDNEEDEDEDETELANVPHPMDLEHGSDLDEDDDKPAKKKADAQELAKRTAFFAPEEEIEEGPADPKSSFVTLGLSRPILRGLNELGFSSPTPIQSKTVPVALEGKDVVGGAVTGSGKTAAFLIPILDRLLYRSRRFPATRVCILMPTRELAVQCHQVATKIAKHTDITFALIVGGLSLREQEQTLRKRPDIVIATPGRFIDHMRNTGAFSITEVEILVLDEADRMLEDGFADELNEILTTIPRSRQTMLFSATMTEDVDKLIRVGLNRPVRLMVDANRQTVHGLVQEFIKMKPPAAALKLADSKEKESTFLGDELYRLAYLLHLVKSTYTARTIIFFPRKALAHRVKVLFALNNISAAELHGSMSQEQRLNAISSFKSGTATHLLATDLASRGLDIPKVETVINFTVPTSEETYLHRVGRTARAGRQGVSCTLFASTKKGSGSGGKKSASERTLLKPILRIAKAQKAAIRTRTIPGVTVAATIAKVHASQTEIDDVLREEKEERLLAQTERDITKSENMVKHEAEIAARPRRTWFQTEKEKNAAKEAGKDARLGLSGEAPAVKKEKKKLSGKDKKRLANRDLRLEQGGSAGWKKGKSERQGAGVLKKAKSGPKDKMKNRNGVSKEKRGGGRKAR